MLEKKTVSQCISSDYCKGWNDAVEEYKKSEKHGRWSVDPDCGCYCMTCNLCGEKYWSEFGVVLPKYCPECGARMDLGAEING